MKWILLFFIPLCLPAQDTNKLAISAEFAYGSLILHSQDIYPIGPSNPYILGVDYSYWLLRKKHWDNCLCYPEFGLSLNYHNMDKPGILGWGLPIYAFIQPHFKIGGNWFALIRGGIGYSWFSAPYHTTENPKNQSYSLHLNPFISLGSGIAYNINNSFLMSFQFKYNHLSNGGQREPNKGLNYPSFNLGLSYIPKELDLPQFKKTLPEKYFKEVSIALFIAGKAIDATHVTYAVPGIQLEYAQQISRLNALSGGIEWINNYAYREKIRQAGTNEDHQQLGLMAGHQFLLGNFRFSQMMGVYIYRDYKIKPSFYQRYTLYWNPIKGFTIGTSLKTHGHVAEFLDFRLGYKQELFKD